MPSAIIDNRNRLLVDEINTQLTHTVKAKIAVGYFFLSGLKAIQEKLDAKDENGEYLISVCPKIPFFVISIRQKAERNLFNPLSYCNIQIPRLRPDKNRRDFARNDIFPEFSDGL